MHNGFEPAELMALCREAGLARARAKTIYRGEKLFMGRDASLFLLDAAAG